MTFFRVVSGVLVAGFCLGGIALGQVKADSFKKSKGAKKKLEDTLESEVKSALFPDWSTPSFDWNVGPIIGLKYSNTSQEDFSTQTVQSELGVRAGLQGVPLVPGNPGLYLAPSVGYSLGRVDGTREYREAGDEDIKYRYARLFGRLDTSAYLGWYRHTLGLSGGRKLFSKEDDSELVAEPDDLYQYAIKNDFGVLVLFWVSAHYTHTYTVAYFDKFSGDPFLTEHDHWLHTRVFTSVLDFYVDIGPGFTNTTEVVDQGEATESKAVGRVDYLKMLSGLKLFWKLGASASAKYVYNSTEKRIGEYGSVLLPDQGIYDSPRVTMPEDSLVASTFVGANDVFIGFGLGWQYNIQILNLSEKDDKTRETTKDHGFVVTYTASF